MTNKTIIEGLESADDAVCIIDEMFSDWEDNGWKRPAELEFSCETLSVNIKAAISALKAGEWCFDMEKMPKDGFFLAVKNNHGEPYVALVWRGHGQEIHHMGGADLMPEFLSWRELPSPPQPEEG